MAHRWLVAKTSIVKGLGIKIDMSAAIDTINRHELLNILESILEEDELRLIRFLLSNTFISLKVNGTEERLSFLSNTGTPQGDSLSLLLFIIYPEHALRHLRPPTGISDLPEETAYEYDVDFISITNHKDVKEVQNFYNRAVIRECRQNRVHYNIAAIEEQRRMEKI